MTKKTPPAPRKPNTDRRAKPRSETSGHHKGKPSNGARSTERLKPRTEKAAPSSEPMRIAKAMARAGLCSRREAERFIEAGRVTVNGKLIDSPALNVTGKDRILIDGTPLPEAEPIRLWRYNKPKGLVTTASDEKGRDTIFDKLPEDIPRTISIGRLDINTEGLLLLTNDGELARHIELPQTGWLRRYKVRANGSITQDKLDSLKKGVTIDGVKFGPVEATLIKQQGANCWFTIGLREGKNREIKRIAEHLGLNVNRLIRLSFGPFILGSLNDGEIEEVKSHILADQLGPKLAEKFNIKPSTAQAQSKAPASKTRKTRSFKSAHHSEQSPDPRKGQRPGSRISQKQSPKRSERPKRKPGR